MDSNANGGKEVKPKKKKKWQSKAKEHGRNQEKVPETKRRWQKPSEDGKRTNEKAKKKKKVVDKVDKPK